MKRHVSLAIPALLLLGLVPEIFAGDNAWFMSIYCKDTQIAIISALLFMAIPRNQTGIKTACLVFSLYTIMEAQFYFLYAFLDYNVYSWSYFVFIFTIGILYFYNRFKQFEYKSDKIEFDHIYLCLWKPKNGITLTASLIGIPFGGLCIYCRGYLYGYRWGMPTYQKSKRTSESVERSFTVVDTMRPAAAMIKILDSLVGTPAGRPRIRCIATIKPVLEKLGANFTPSFFELIPSIYARKILP